MTSKRASPVITPLAQARRKVADKHKAPEPVAVPAKPYEPSAAERAATAEQDGRIKEKGRPPRLKIVDQSRDETGQRTAKVMRDHPDKDAWFSVYLQAFGTVSDDLANMLTEQIAASYPAARGAADPGILNAVLAVLHGIQPRDEIEALLVSQMIMTHMNVAKAFNRQAAATTIEGHDSYGNIATKMMRTFTTQVEALAKYRGKGQQKVVVEHVHVYPGGHAIVGNVNRSPGGGGATLENGNQSHAISNGHAQCETLSGEVEAVRNALPIPLSEG
jgi:hypothetical protein